MKCSPYNIATFLTLILAVHLVWGILTWYFLTRRAFLPDNTSVPFNNWTVDKFPWFQFCRQQWLLLSPPAPVSVGGDEFFRGDGGLGGSHMLRWGSFGEGERLLPEKQPRTQILHLGCVLWHSLKSKLLLFLLTCLDPIHGFLQMNKIPLYLWWML